MSKRKPTPWDLGTHMRCRLATFPGAAHVRREVAELRALKAVVRASRRQVRARAQFVAGGCTWDHWIDCVNEEERSLARLDKVTGRSKR